MANPTGAASSDEVGKRKERYAHMAKHGGGTSEEFYELKKEFGELVSALEVQQ